MYDARYFLNADLLSHHEKGGMLHDHIPDLQFLVKIVAESAGISGLLDSYRLRLFCELRVEIEDGVFDGEGDMIVDEVVGVFLLEERDDFGWEVVHLFLLDSWRIEAAIFEFV